MSKQYSVLTELKLKANEFNKGMNDAAQKTTGFAKSFADKTKSVGQNMSKIGSSMTKKVTLPIAAGATGAVAAFKNFDDSMRNTQALLGDKLGGTVQEQEKNLGVLSDKAKEMGIQTRFSASEAADAMGYMALAGWDTTQIMSGVEPVLNLAAAANMDLATASDIVTDAMSMFSMEAHEAERMTDVLAATSSSTNTNVEQLGEALVYVGANAHAAGMDIETTSSILGILADNGLKGSKAGTTLNAILRDMKASAEDGAIAIGDQSVALYDSNGNMRDMTDVIDDVIGATDGMTDAQRDAALSQVFGQEAIKGMNILLNEGAGATKNLRDELYLSEGTASKMAEILEGGLGGSLRELKSALEGLAISFGETLAPMLSKGIDWLTKWIRKFADLDEGTKKTIITIAGLAAAIGPVLLIGGKLIVGISSVVSAFTAVSGAVTAAGGAMALLTNPIGWVVAAIGAAVAIGVAWYKNFDKLEEKFGTVGATIIGLLNPITSISTAIKLFKKGQESAIEEVDRFGDKVSENTQKVLGKYFELSDNTQVALNEMAWANDEVTKKSAQKMMDNYDEMNDQIIEGMQERHQEEITETNEQFQHLKGLSDERQTEILEQLNEQHNEEIESQQEKNDRINEIFELASQEKRALTQDEYDEITQLNNEMNENAVHALSENEMESQIILERMNAQTSELTAQQAAEVVRNSKKATDGAIEEANKQYDETIAWIVRQRDETGTISAEEADELIKQAKKQRDETVEQAEDRHKNVVSEAQKQADEHVEKVDWETGEVLSKWQMFKKNTGKVFSDIGSSIKDAWNNSKDWTIEKTTELKEGAVNKFNELKNNTSDKFNEIKSSITDKITEAKTNAVNKFTELKTGITDKITEAKNNVSNKVDEIKGFFTNMKLKIPEVATDAVTKAKNAVSNKIDEIKGFFTNLKLKLPKISLPKMPEFTITGKFGWKPPTVPKIGINWNAQGGIFNRPTIFNTANAGLQGVGEAGAEAVLPLTRSVLGEIGDRIFENMNTNSLAEYTTTTNNNNNDSTYNFNFTIDKVQGTEKDGQDFAKGVVNYMNKRGINMPRR